MVPLRRKLLLGLLLILVSVMLIATIFVSAIVVKQSRTAAAETLRNTFNVIRYTLTEKQSKLLADVRHIIAVEDLGGKISYLVDSRQYFKYSIMRPTYIGVTSILYNLCSSADIWKVSVYDIEGKSLSFVDMGG